MVQWLISKIFPNKKPKNGKVSQEALLKKTVEGTDWAAKRYRRTFERLAEYDRS